MVKVAIRRPAGDFPEDLQIVSIRAPKFTPYGSLSKQLRKRSIFRLLGRGR